MVDPHHPMADDGPDQAQRDGGHDHQWPGPAGEDRREYEEDEREPQDEPQAHVAPGVALIGGAPLEAVGHAVALHDVWQQVAHQGLLNGAGGVLGTVDVRRHLHRQTPVRMAQGLESTPGLTIRHRVQVNEPAARDADAQPLQGVEPGTLGARQQHPHLQLVLTDLNQLGQVTVEGGAQLPAQELGGHPQRLTRR